MARVLIVEDMAMIALELKDSVEALGHEVVGIAGSIESALDKIRDLDPQPQLVMLDADLRGRSALPIAKCLRQHHIPFVVCSGWGTEVLDALRIDEPSLTKPFDETQLRIAIDELTKTA